MGKRKRYEGSGRKSREGIHVTHILCGNLPISAHIRPSVVDAAAAASWFDMRIAARMRKEKPEVAICSTLLCATASVSADAAHKPYVPPLRLLPEYLCHDYALTGD